MMGADQPPTDAHAKGRAMQSTARARAVFACLVLLSTVFVGCVSFSVSTTGAASAEDLAAENAYVALYMDHMTRYAEDLKAFAVNGDSPGPCNKGGNKQGCFDADTSAIATLTAMLEALKAAEVPPRFVEPDRLLREALTKNIEGLELRNQALVNGDDNVWAQHATVLEEAGAAWTAGYAAFPADHRPSLGP